ncbi:MAG: serine hydrolase [Flavobacteriaceae bacterium]|nr:serine hydrolase [Flavobacteriaceae bacterium]
MKLFNSLILLLFISHFTFGQNLEKQLDTYLNEVYASDKPGATVMIAKDGKPIFRKAYGMADLELGVPMKPDNVFEIGSITKQFTAVSILMLEEQGKLSVDDDILKFIPDYPTNGHTITIHHLLNHTSGIKSYTAMESFQKNARVDMSPTEIIDFFKNEPMDFEPGEQFLYNNSGYIILGHIIEVVSGLSYAEFIEKNIFEPLGMKNSYYGSMTNLIPNRASGYQNRDGYVNAEYLSLSLPYAAGSIMSNVDDLLTWQNAIRDNKLISAETHAKAVHGSELNDGTHIAYGYGWGENNINGSKGYQHGGGIFGYTTMGIYLPEEDVYAAILTNCDCDSPGGVTTKILAMAIGKPYPDVKEAITLNDGQLKTWVGAYQFEDGAVRFITLENGKLQSQREGSTKFEIFALDTDYFIFEEGTISYKFSNDGEGKRHVVMSNNGALSTGHEIGREPPAPKEEISLDESVLKTYIGKYEMNPEFLIEIRVRAGEIFAQASGQPEFQLFAEAEDKFFLKVIPAEIEFNKEDSGSVSGMTLMQGGQKIPLKKIE